MAWLGALVIAVLALAWAGFLFWLGQRKKANASTWFYALLYGPTILGSILGFLLEPGVYFVMANVLGPWFVLVLALGALERLLWGWTLKEAAGEDKLVWFYLIFFVPLFGWLLYRITNLR